MTEEASDGGTQSHSPPLHTTPSANGESSGYGGVYAFDSSLNYRRGTVPASSLEERGFGNVDLSTLPMEYLENYPYPAFVLLIPIPPTPTDPSGAKFPFDLPWASAPQFVGTQPFTPVWCNRRWDSLAGELSLLDLLDFGDVREMGVWLTGSHYSPNLARLKGMGSGRIPGGADIEDVEKLISQKTDSKVGVGDLPPQANGCEAYSPDVQMPRAERLRNHRDEKHDPESASTFQNEPWDRTFRPLTLRFNFPRATATLDLVRATMTAHQHDSVLGTHTYAVITTIPRGEVFWLDSSVAKRNESATCPVVREAPRGENSATAEGMSPGKLKATVLDDTAEGVVFLGASGAGAMRSDDLLPGAPNSADVDAFEQFRGLDLQPGRPLIFHRDGTVSYQPGGSSATTADGRSLDVHTLLETTDWSKTSLGPRESWPGSLNGFVDYLMAYPLKGCIWWGEDLTLMYNQSYANSISAHPYIWGQGGPASWAEVWGSLGPLTEAILSGTPVFKEDGFVTWKHVSSHELSQTVIKNEKYLSQIWIPLKKEDGTMGGLMYGTRDQTKGLLADRRTALIREIGERTSTGRSVADFDRGLLDTLDAHPKDAPFALLFHVEQLSSSPSRTRPKREGNPSLIRLRFAGGVGVPADHPSAPETLTLTCPSSASDIGAMLADAFPSQATPQTTPRSPDVSTLSAPSDTSAAIVRKPLPRLLGDHAVASGPGSGTQQLKGSQWPFMDVLATRQPVLVEDIGSLISGYPVRIWDALPDRAVLLPITRNSEDMPTAVLVLGLSCRIDFDEDYEAFLHVLRLQMASNLAAVRSYQDDLQRIDDLNSLDRAKSVLFSNVSHELYSPLTLISGPLDDVISQMESGPQRNSLVLARGNARRLSRLVSMLMDISSLEAGRLKGSFQQVNLGVSSRDVAALFAKAAQKAGLEYIVECDLSVRDVYVDRDMWEKILFTLIGNAIRYTRQGSIRISLEYTEQEAVFTITDTGIGMPLPQLNFIREHHSTEATSKEIALQHEGASINLFFTKKMIQLLHGVLEIDSKRGEEFDDDHGSTFTIRLPLGRSHLPESAIYVPQSAEVLSEEVRQWHDDWEVMQDAVSDDTNSSKSSEATVTSPIDQKSTKSMDEPALYFMRDDVVMLVDDLRDTRRYMRSIFEPFCTVIEARDGKEALELYGQYRPDLIIADMILPRMDGTRLLSALRSGTREQQMVPFIMLTSTENARATGALVADDYLSKPFNARELLTRAHLQLQLGKKRQALETLFDERTAELRVLTEHSPVPTFRCTREGYISYANAAWYEISGYPQDQEISNWGEYIAEGDRARVKQLWETFVADTHSPSLTTEWQWTNGRWAMVTMIRPEGLQPGSKIGSIGCAVDITERKLNEELQRQRVADAEQRRAEAEEAKRQQELLIDITSHEIRNPISSLMQISSTSTLSYSSADCSSMVKANLLTLQEKLKMALDDEKGMFQPSHDVLQNIAEDLEALDSIYQCGLTQERISNDVLSLSKIQLDMLQMFDVETNIPSFANKLMGIFQYEAKLNRIQLTLDISPAFEQLGLSTIMTDPVRLSQIVTNLLSNAIRFTSNRPIRRIKLRFDVTLSRPLIEDQARTPSPQIEPNPSSNREPGPTDPDTIFLVVSVSDTGPGLTPAELAVLFQRFSQASPETHTVFGGSGLGLFVCRKIAERMQGRISVVSDYGHGSEFRVFIQAKRAFGAVADIDKGTSQHTLPTESPKMAINRETNLRVLVVEDNQINRTVILRQLTKAGMSTDSANDGLEALAKIRAAMTHHDATATPYDCVLMDIEMPVMDGYTAARLVREDEQAGHLMRSNIVALTGNARQATIGPLMLDFDDVVVKPYRIDHLLGTIKKLVENNVSTTLPVASL